ncbi:MATE family efflux transporter [uncultured Ruthenibacterium sp.]|uniref:MATE family efflux transporter n=1 Tax=uncultured Ruthenibacterium sp. TaxID=1905347 RepID=UPI00349E976F
MTTTLQTGKPMFTGAQLRTLLVPLVIEQILVVAVGMADTMMVSAVGEAAVSGVSLVDMLNLLISNLFAALATGGAVVTSQFLGARRNAEAQRSAGQLVLLTVLISLAVAVLSVGLRSPLLRLAFGAIEDDVMDAAMLYWFITALSYPFLAVYNASAALFRCQNNTRLGVAGVAIPTLLSRVLGCLVLTGLLCQEHNALHLRVQDVLHVEPGLVRRILRIGIPSAVENSLFQLGRIMVVGIIAGFGTVQIAANAVANNLDGLGCIPGDAVNLAMITVVGRCIGAGDTKQAAHYAKKLVGLVYLMGGVLNISILLSLPLLLNLYTLSAETAALATTLVWIHDGFAMLLWPASFTLPNALRAAGDVRYTMSVSIFSIWAFRFGFGYLLGAQMGMGAVGIWIAMLLDWSFRGVCFIVRFARGKWKEKKVI